MKKLFVILFAISVILVQPVYAEYAEHCTMVRASHILVKTKAEADQLEFYLSKGASFEALANRYSLCPSGRTGGDLNYFHKGQMVKHFEEKDFSMKKGEISQPIQTQFGWHIIKVTGKICD